MYYAKLDEIGQVQTIFLYNKTKLNYARYRHRPIASAMDRQTDMNARHPFESGARDDAFGWGRASGRVCGTSVGARKPPPVWCRFTKFRTPRGRLRHDPGQQNQEVRGDL